ncbi:MAG: nuclease-related domain-containing protein [Thermodesulfobacteriota bacterium]
MIIKRMDSKKEEIGELAIFLKSELTPYQRFLIEKELKAMRSGVYGEKDSAYYIDFYFGNSRNWAVIHDLRLEHKGQVAQIDHLLINRFFDIYALESKNYSYKLKITSEGEFQVYYGKEYIGIPSPIEQSKRHIHLLDLFLRNHNILPKRMGISIRPRFKDLILVSPKCIITRPPEKKFDTSSVIKADTLRTKIDREVDKWHPLADLAAISKTCSSSNLEETARRLAAFHKPKKVDFRARFGLSVQKDWAKGQR